MQFANRDVKKAFAQSGQTTLTSVKRQTKSRYEQTLRFMQEWTNDLMEREN